MGSDRGRSLALDLLRAVAILLVLGRHLEVASVSDGAVLRALSLVWHRGGWVGVDLFFVLSGFLVAGLLFREFRDRGRVDAGRFLLRRGLKIYPAFWGLLLCTLVVRGIRHEPIPLRPLLGELLFLQNYLTGLWSHTWSLAVEEHFYLLLALGIWWRLRASASADPFRPLPLLWGGVALACLALRVGLAGASSFDVTRQLYPTHLRIDALLFGTLLAYAWHLRGWHEAPRLRRLAPALIVLGIAAVVPAFLFDLDETPWISSYGLTLFYLGFGALLLGVLYLPSPSGRGWTWLGRLGARSYSIYLWHLPVKDWLVPLVERAVGHPLLWIQMAALYLAGALLIGSLMARLLEYPILRLRDRFLPSRAISPA